MDEVVLRANGERVDQLLPPNDPQRPENADYVFRQDAVVAELKSLQQEVFTPEYRDKLNALARSWHDRGLIRLYGTTVVEMRRLPLTCQREWLRLLTQPLQTMVVSKSNKQIEQTKELLSLPHAKGVLLLANDGNTSFDPYNLITLISQILRKLHPDGSAQYSSIHSVSFFSANLPVSSSLLSVPAVWWFNGHRPSSTDSVAQLLQRLEGGWHERLSNRIGYQIPRVRLPEDALEKLTFC